MQQGNHLTTDFMSPELTAWRDWRSSLSLTIHTLAKSPFLVLSFVVASCISCAAPCSSGWDLVLVTWAELNSQVHEVTNADLARVVSAFGNALVSGVLGGIGLLLLLIPGVLILARGSLGIVFVCLEKRTAIAAFKASWKMTKGHFWLTFRYLAPITLAISAGYILIVAVAWIIDPAIIQDGSFSSGASSIKHLPAIALLALGYFATQLLYISITPLQVKLYSYLQKISAR